MNKTNFILIYKPPFLPPKLKFGLLPLIKDLKGRDSYFITNRDSIISKRFLNLRVVVAGTHDSSSFLIRKSMLGFKFGQFSLTKALGRSIHPAPDKFRTKRMTARKKSRPRIFNNQTRIKNKKVTRLNKNKKFKKNPRRKK
jgi:ribosomal protein S19